MKRNVFPSAEAKAQVCKLEKLQVTLEITEDAGGYTFFCNIFRLALEIFMFQIVQNPETNPFSFCLILCKSFVSLLRWRRTVSHCTSFYRNSAFDCIHTS